MPTVFGWNLIATPSNPAAGQSMEWTAVDIIGENLSPFTGRGQIQDWQASWLEASVSMPPLTHAQAQQWIAFLMALRGKKCVFQMGDPLARSPLGSGSGSPVVNGSGQTGYALATRGWSSGAPGVLLAGDWLQVGYRLYRNLVTANADGGGGAVLSIWPQLREAPTDGTSISVNNTLGLWRLKSNARKWSETQARTYGMQFEMREAI